jgi:hypothetical protein
MIQASRRMGRHARPEHPHVMGACMIRSHAHAAPPQPACSYYVRSSSKPKERAAIAVVVKVGSLVEQDQEQGVAHILEHLAFNATEVGARCCAMQGA